MEKKEVKKSIIYEFTCKNCDKEFTSKHSQRVFCSPECSQSYPIKEANQKWIVAKTMKTPRYVQQKKMQEEQSKGWNVKKI